LFFPNHNHKPKRELKDFRGARSDKAQEKAGAYRENEITLKNKDYN
jgi:hypothetical protein